MAPTRFRWTYSGGADGSVEAARRRGAASRERAAGNLVVHDIFFQCNLDSLMEVASG
jgi:hypothetical protein